MSYYSYRAYYTASDDGFGSPDCPKDECGGGSATLLANSLDGLTWGKPDLGLFNWTGQGVFQGQNSSHTNIVFEDTTSVAIFDDVAHETNASRRFKVWGNLAAHMLSRNKLKTGAPPLTPALAPAFSQSAYSHVLATGTSAKRMIIDEAVAPPALGKLPWKAPQVGGVAVSANGIDFTDYRLLQNTTDPRRDRWRFDAQASMFFDDRRQKYVGTDRAFRPCDHCGLCPIWWQPHGGCQAHRGAHCTEAECNLTVRAIGSVTTTTGNWDTAEWGENVQILSTVQNVPHPDPSQQLYSQVQ